MLSEGSFKLVFLIPERRYILRWSILHQWSDNPSEGKSWGSFQRSTPTNQIPPFRYQDLQKKGTRFGLITGKTNHHQSSTTMNRLILMLSLFLLANHFQAQPPSIRIPQRWILTFDTAYFFEDRDTTNTTVMRNPSVYSTSVYPDGRKIVLDLLKPSIEGLSFNMLGECDQEYADLLGAELMTEGGEVFHFLCAEGWYHTVLISEYHPIAKVVLFHPADEGVMGLMFNAKLTIEPIDIAHQSGP